MRDLRAHDVDMLTVGQYLQPSAHHLPVLRYAEPAMFEEFERRATEARIRARCVRAYGALELPRRSASALRGRDLTAAGTEQILHATLLHRSCGKRKEIWKAASVVAEANFLITAEPRFRDRTPSRPNVSPGKLRCWRWGKTQRRRRQLSKYCWIFFLESGLNEVFQTLVDHLGVEHHSYTAVDLKEGEGLSYDAEKRVVCEIYSKNWSA